MWVSKLVRSCILLPAAGYNCEMNQDDCVPNPCEHGECIDEVDGYRCVCRLPYSGRNCSTQLDPCSPNQCLNGAACIPDATYTTFSCQCRKGFTGNRYFVYLRATRES